MTDRRPALQRAVDKLADPDPPEFIEPYRFTGAHDPGRWREHLRWPRATPLIGEQLLRAIAESA